MRLLAPSAAALALLAAPPARASGGAQVVDDSEVEAPGRRHPETWGIDGASGAAVSLGVTLRR